MHLSLPSYTGFSTDLVPVDWESHTTPDTGAVALSGLTFTNWTGHVDNGVSRGPIVIRGLDKVPLTDVTLTDTERQGNHQSMRECVRLRQLREGKIRHDDIHHVTNHHGNAGRIHISCTSGMGSRGIWHN